MILRELIMNHTISKNNLEVIKNRYFFTKKFIKKKRILEIGCGFGIGFSYLYEDCRDYLGIDINKSQINEAKHHNVNYKNKFKNLKLSELKNINKKFDLIICLATIYYLEIEEFLDVSKKLLASDGQIIFDTSNKNVPGFDSKWDNQSKYYDVSELNDILKKKDFKSNYYGAFFVNNNKQIKTNTLKIRSFAKKLFKLLKLNFLKKIILFFLDKKFYTLPYSIKDKMNNYNYNFQLISPIKKCYNYKVIFVSTKLNK